jgi:hypothetical protein
MRWVTDLWGAREGYNTARSAFWRVLRRIVLSDPAGVADADRWSSRLAWTNLYKVSPGAGWNPGADLQRAQHRDAAELLRLELAEFAPKRVLALTGGWVDPFIGDLGLSLEPRPATILAAGPVGSVESRREATRCFHRVDRGLPAKADRPTNGCSSAGPQCGRTGDETRGQASRLRTCWVGNSPGGRDRGPSIAATIRCERVETSGSSH